MKKNTWRYRPLKTLLKEFQPRDHHVNESFWRYRPLKSPSDRLWAALTIPCIVCFIIGVVVFPSAPIRPAGDKYVDKGGGMHSAAYYQAFLWWESVFLVTFPVGFLANVCYQLNKWRAGRDVSEKSQ